MMRRLVAGSVAIATTAFLLAGGAYAALEPSGFAMRGGEDVGPPVGSFQSATAEPDPASLAPPTPASAATPLAAPPPAEPAPVSLAPPAETAPPVAGGPAAPVPSSVESAISFAVAGLPSDATLAGRDGSGVTEFYTARAFAPAWTAGGTFTAAGVALIARLWEADADGLNPAAYVIPDPAIGVLAPATDAEVGAADVALSVAIAAYVREAYAGRLDPRSIDPNLDIRPHYPDPDAALVAIAAAADPVAQMAGYNPTHPGYVALRGQLAILRATPEDERIVIPPGPTLRLGDTDERLPVIRARLDLAPAADDVAHVYDETVRTAVTAFQSSAGLTSDGILGPNTLGALNGPPVDPEHEIIANMERWRWLPRDLGRFHVFVNIPEFVVRIFRDGAVAHQTRVVVGLPTNQTPVFSDQIDHMMVNPYWNVPASIVAAELLPQIRRDPAYFERNGYDIWLRWEGQTYSVTPYEVNWAMVQPTQVSFRQRPGPANALGQIKFMFPNSHDVYLHDTPSKSLFQRDARAFSHGCIRVMNPMEFADALLMEDPNLDADDLRALFGPNETRVDLASPVPVHLAYFTATVDANGNLRFFNDVYGHAAKVRAALGL